MKKIWIIILIIILVLAVIGGIVFFSLNREKIAISASAFQSSMQEKGYTVVDATSQFSNYPYVEQVYLAVQSDYNYQIEFYTLSDESYAIGMYNNNKANFESSKGNGSVSSNISINNYAKFTLQTNGKYQVVSRIANTLIYLNVDDSYKEEVNKILSESDY